MIQYQELNAEELLRTLTVEDIEKVYEGTPGCGCGCNGDYYEDEAAKQRVLRAVRRSAAKATASVGGPFGGPPIIALETSSRYRWISLR